MEKMKEEYQRHATFTLISTLSKEKVPAVGLMREDKNSQPARDGFPEEQRTGRDTGVCDASGLLFSLLERRIRKAGNPLTSAVRGKLKNPTGQEILKHLAGVQVVVTGSKTRQILVPQSKQTAFREILSMAGIGFEAYTRVPEPACRSG